VLAGYLYAQVFIGYSETLVAYDQRSDPPHVLLGYALTR
jgi:outer membrane phospholipase A